jgi:hypothetical protein
MTEQAKQTPLVELLDAVPEDVFISVQDGEVWHAGTTWRPVGRLCRDAAAKLRRLHALNGELLEALKLAQSIIGHPEDAHSKLIAAAIAKAEGEKT